MGWTTTRARIAGLKRQNPEADVDDLKRVLRAERAEEYVRDLVAGWPPLSVEQRSRIAVLLLTAPSGDGSVAT